MPADARTKRRAPKPRQAPTPPPKIDPDPEPGGPPAHRNIRMIAATVDAALARLEALRGTADRLKGTEHDRWEAGVYGPAKDALDEAWAKLHESLAQVGSGVLIAGGKLYFRNPGSAGTCP